VDPRPYKDFRWIVADPELLGGKLTICGTRLSVSFILSCMADGMSVEEIEATYGSFPREAIPEIMKLASEFLDAPNVAAKLPSASCSMMDVCSATMLPSTFPARPARWWLRRLSIFPALSLRASICPTPGK
jgi:uncharacterized protein (DUF433 family)